MLVTRNEEILTELNERYPNFVSLIRKTEERESQQLTCATFCEMVGRDSNVCNIVNYADLLEIEKLDYIDFAEYENILATAPKNHIDIMCGDPITQVYSNLTKGVGGNTLYFDLIIVIEDFFQM